MPGRQSANELARKAELQRELIRDYKQYCKEQAFAHDDISASAFAIRRLGNSTKYMNMTEREIVSLLRGTLPSNFD
jgi:hypothetical protein